MFFPRERDDGRAAQGSRLENFPHFQKMELFLRWEASSGGGSAQMALYVYFVDRSVATEL